MNKSNDIDIMADDFGLKFSDDPKYIHIGETFKSVLFAIIKHLHVAKRIVKHQNLDGNIELHAGKIYNNYMVTNILSTNTMHDNEILDQELESFATIFKSSIEKKIHLKGESVKFTDPILHLFEFCKYFFIPVRLNTSTLSDDVKINSIRKWITIILSLPFNKEYTRKYEDVVANIDYLQQATDKIFENSITMEKMENITDEFVGKTIAKYKTNNTAQRYIRLIGYITIISSVEVMKKYCPNIYECMKINPHYDGSWVNPFDKIFNEQVADINTLLELCDSSNN